jgi:hypothetical protein
VRMDPRVRTPAAALAQQHALARRLAEGMNRAAAAQRGVPNDSSTRAVARAADDLLALYEIVQGADVAPTAQTATAVDARLRALDALLTRRNP